MLDSVVEPEIHAMLDPEAADRVTAALAARRDGRTVYLENGRPAGSVD